MVSIKKQ